MARTTRSSSSRLFRWTLLSCDPHLVSLVVEEALVDETEDEAGVTALRARMNGQATSGIENKNRRN